MNDETVTVIVPVYKVEDYLEKCIESIEKQDYTNLEIILVDDGSPDKCPEICDGYAKKDRRIRVLHKKNGGLADARNAGVENCRTRYATFVDSDDVVDTDHVSTLVRLLKEYNAEIACTPLIYEFENGKKKEIISFSEQELDTYSAKCMIMRARYGIGVTACSKLLPVKALLSNPFPVGRLHEDLAISMQLYDSFSRIAISSHATYHYIQRSTSITHSTIDQENLIWIVDYMKSLIQDNPDKDIDMHRALVYRLYDLVNEYCRVIDTQEERVLINEMLDTLRPYRRTYIHDPENGLLTKIKGIMLSGNRLSFGCFCRLKELYSN